jgi:hypothetical protein
MSEAGLRAQKLGARLREFVGLVFFEVSVMGLSYRRFILFLTLFACLPAFGAAIWRQPTADELKMTSDPAAPDAAAVYLNHDE